MKKEFLQLSVEELLEEKEFIGWLLYESNKQAGDSFMAENPGFKVKVSKAREIIDLLRDHHDHLENDDLLQIWKNIEDFEEQVRDRKRLNKLHSFLRYAAILIVILSIVSAGYLIYNKQLKSYHYTAVALIGSSNQSQLILSNGKTVELEKENSKVAMKGDQKIVIDNDKVIDLSKETQPEESKMNEMVVPYGKRSQLTLEDGTKVWLNAGSRMAFPTKFTGKKREVFLEGEGYFEVAHNKDMPFFVNTGQVAVKVLGTKFDISAYQNDGLIETVLLEGKVALSERSALGLLKHEMLMAPNQKASFDKTRRTLSIKNEPDAYLSIAWTEGWLKFSKQNMNDVFVKLQRYFNIQIILDKKLSTDDLITGKLDLKESVDAVMIALSDIANIQYRIEGNKIFISRKKGNG
jgi:ferric-dicitrate binding protein FerR (iron transport regulator)